MIALLGARRGQGYILEILLHHALNTCVLIGERVCHFNLTLDYKVQLGLVLPCQERKGELHREERRCHRGALMSARLHCTHG